MRKVYGVTYQQPPFSEGPHIDARDTAIIFEGGGMRNSYTAACVAKLVEEGVECRWVGGVSAGASHVTNYLSQDADRAEHSFVEFVNNPSFGGIGSLLRGNGYFNAEFIYERSADNELPFDWDTFSSHPTEMHLEAMRADTGETVRWTRQNIPNLKELVVRVRASSTLPLIMPMPIIDGAPYVDGALGETGGIVIDAAEKTGAEKFLFIATKPRDYIRPEVPRPQAVRRFFRKTPAVAEALIRRPARYNAAKQRLLELEREGRALLFFPDDMRVSSTERNAAKLRANFEAGRTQTANEWPAWKEFLGAD